MCWGRTKQRHTYKTGGKTEAYIQSKEKRWNGVEGWGWCNKKRRGASLQMRGLEARRQFKQAWLPLRHDRLLIPRPHSHCLPHSHVNRHTQPSSHHPHLTHTHSHTCMLAYKTTKKLNNQKHSRSTSVTAVVTKTYKNVQMHMQNTWNAQALWKYKLYNQINLFNPSKTAHTHKHAHMHIHIYIFAYTYAHTHAN